jgi:hypothetical protein
VSDGDQRHNRFQAEFKDYYRKRSLENRSLSKGEREKLKQEEYLREQEQSMAEIMKKKHELYEGMPNLIA